MFFPMQSNAPGSDDNKKKLVDMLTRHLQAAPLFGGTGKGSSDLPQVGAPSISFNPFLKMLAGRPGETFNDLPSGIDQSVASGIQGGIGPVQGGSASGDPGVFGSNGGVSQPAMSGGYTNTVTNGIGHDYGVNVPYSMNNTPTSSPAPVQATGGTSIPVSTTNPLYHTLLWMLGTDR